MERKFVLAIIAFTVLVTAALVFFLLHEDAVEPLKELSPREPVQEEVVVDPVLEEPAPESSERERVRPEELVSEELARMPDSFRKCMGGIKGRVVEEDGEPVAEMKVEVFGAGLHELFRDVETFMGDEAMSYELKTVRSITKEDGTFFLPGIYPRKYYVLSIDSGGPRSFLRILDILPGPGEVVDLGDIVLPFCAVLTGIVNNDDGHPICGARIRAAQLPPIVYLSGIQDYREGCSFLIKERKTEIVFDPPPVLDQVFGLLPIPSTLSDSDGSFRLEGVPHGVVSVVVDCPDHVTAMPGPVSVKKGKEKDLGFIELDRGVPMKGKVVASDGKPLKGVEVRAGMIHSFKEFTILKPSVHSDEEGAFSLPGFALRPAMAAARQYPEDPWTVVGPFNPAGETVTIRLPPTYSLRVMVVLEDDTPVKNARLKLRYFAPSADELIFLTPSTVPVHRMKKLEKGIFEIRDLPPGRYELLATAPGCAVVQGKAKVKEEPVEMKIILPPSLEARVRVFSAEDHTPVEWAEVYTTQDDEDMITRPFRINRARTDDAGLAVLKKLAPGENFVTVSHPGYAIAVQALEAPSKEEKVIHLERGGTVEGVVHSGRSEYQGPCMIILGMRSYSDTNFRRSPEVSTPHMAVTDLEGKFRITNLTPGTWRLWVERRIFHKELSTLIDAVDMDTLKRETVEVKSGETTYVEIFLGDTGPSAPVAGRVTVDGEPAAGAQIQLWMGKSYNARTDEAGRYDLGQVTVGNGMLRLDSVPHTPSLVIGRNISIEENIPLFEDFDIITGTIDGRVVSEQGGTVTLDGDSRIFGYMEEQSGPYTAWISTRITRDGAFTMDKVPMGVYLLRGGYEEKDPVFEPVSNVKVFPGRRTGPVQVTLIDPFTVKGRVVLSEDYDYFAYLRLYCTTEDESLGFFTAVDVSPETGEFETTRFRAGTYTGRLFGVNGVAFKPITFTIPPGGITNLVLTPEEE